MSPLPPNVSEELEHLQPHQVGEAAALLVDAFLNDSDSHGPAPYYDWIFEELLLEDQKGTNDDPPRPRRYYQRNALHWLFCKNLYVHLERDASENRKTACRCAFLREPDQPPKMICFFLLSSHEVKVNDSSICFGAKSFISTKSKISEWTMVRHGMLWFPVLFGWKAFHKLLVSKDFSDSLNEKYLLSRVNLESHSSSVEITPALETTESICRNGSSTGSLTYLLLERMVVHPSMHGKGIGSYFLRKALYSERQYCDGVVTASTSDDSTVRTYDFCLLQADKERNVGFYSRLGFNVVEKVDFETPRFAPGITSWLMVLSAPTKES
jgi:GNAT superfamily N-acetyltransferase